jgi:hypothetical protein
MGTEWEGHNSYVNFTYRQSILRNKPQVVELMPGQHKTPRSKKGNIHCFMCYLSTLNF